jgi:hypothetical protein
MWAHIPHHTEDGCLRRRIAFPTDTLLNKVSLPLVQARIAMQRGNPALAVQLLETAGPYEGSALFQIAYLRGQAYLDLRRGVDAADEFQKMLDHTGLQTASLFARSRMWDWRAPQRSPATRQRHAGPSARG